MSWETFKCIRTRPAKISSISLSVALFVANLMAGHTKPIIKQSQLDSIEFGFSIRLSVCSFWAQFALLIHACSVELIQCWAQCIKIKCGISAVNFERNQNRTFNACCSATFLFFDLFMCCSKGRQTWNYNHVTWSSFILFSNFLKEQKRRRDEWRKSEKI